MKIKHALLYLFVLLLFWQCNNPQTEILQSPIALLGVTSQRGMVVSAREEASKIGRDIMQQGGNAFDAMNTCSTGVILIIF